MSTPTTARARGPVRGAERALAPDLARGVMLLLIVLSNTAFHLWAAPHGPSGWHPVDGSLPDRVVQFAMITALDLRAYPLFAFLFGYGLMRVFARQTEAGTDPRAATRLLRRRGLWLIVFGGAHAALLMAGDIMGSYGVATLLLCALFLRRSDRTILIGAAVALAILAMTVAPAVAALLGGDLGRLGSAPSEATTVVYASGDPSWLAAAGTRLTTWSFVTAAGGLLSFPAHLMMLLGFWAARRRILERPREFLPLLRRTAVVGVTLGWLTGLPSALAHVGLWTVPADAVAEGGALALLQESTGWLGGLGYVALFTLLAHRIAARPAGPGRAARALAALGKRSLSGYLAHSLLFAPLLAAWGLGLGAHLGSATMALFAVGVWLVTVVAADALERRGLPGPADALLRRLVYGRGRPAARRRQGSTV
ncbi:DUF418 domain-containing protein [Streptomyces harbinensis]|uniref:DUF418 domain-containing protein n=1 Tax=Streptomyces harbinensis TaxID=1176198 RepID=UPI003394F784